MRRPGSMPVIAYGMGTDIDSVFASPCQGSDLPEQLTAKSMFALGRGNYVPASGARDVF